MYSKHNFIVGGTPKNAGQIIKQLLLDNGCNLVRFKPGIHSSFETTTDADSTENIYIRRKKRR